MGIVEDYEEALAPDTGGDGRWLLRAVAVGLLITAAASLCIFFIIR